MEKIKHVLFVNQLDARCAVCGKMLGFRKMFAGEMFLCTYCEERIYDMTINFHKRVQLERLKKSLEQKIVSSEDLSA